MQQRLSSSFTWLLLAACFTCVQAAQPTENTISIHGTLMGLAFGFMFPFGAAIMHLFKFKGFVWFHAGWQIVAYMIAVAGFGLGVWIATDLDLLKAKNGHPVIGIIVIAVLFFQPIGGFLAHRAFGKNNSKTTSHLVHRWVGRIFLLLGAINGGLGLQLTANTAHGEIIYGVITAFFFLVWAASVVFDQSRNTRREKTEA